MNIAGAKRPSAIALGPLFLHEECLTCWRICDRDDSVVNFMWDSIVGVWIENN